MKVLIGSIIGGGGAVIIGIWYLAGLLAGVSGPQPPKQIVTCQFPGSAPNIVTDVHASFTNRGIVVIEGALGKEEFNLTHLTCTISTNP